MTRHIRSFLAALAAGGLGLSGCATLPPAAETAALCAGDGVSLHADFPTAGQHRCLVRPDGAVIVRTDPEVAIAPRINPSPWFAFDIEREEAGAIEIVLDYGGYRHRYEPRILRPGEDWQRVDPAHIEVLEEDNRARLTLDLPAGRTRISAQPTHTPADVADWSAAFADTHGFTAVEYGRSLEGRPLQALISGPADAGRLLVALTRQHPPEYSGGRAFEAFAAAIGAAHDGGALAGYRLVLVPLANPDGMANGHWRLNSGGMDLNRDWFAAGQPEIAALQALIRREAEGRDVEVFLDFHSTRRTLVYNPPAGIAARGDALMAEMAARFAAALDPQPDWIEGHNAEAGTSKAWALQTFGVAGLTVELADEASVEESHTVGRLAAEAVLAVAEGH